MKKSKWAYRVYWIKNGKKFGRSEQFAQKEFAQKYLDKYSKRFNVRFGWEGKIIKEKKTEAQKEEEKVINRSDAKKKWDKYRMELLIDIE